MTLLVEEVIDLSLDVRRRDSIPTFYRGVIVVRADDALGNTGAGEPYPDGDKNQGGFNASAIPSEEAAKQELEPKRERHSPLSLLRLSFVWPLLEASASRALIKSLLLRRSPVAVIRLIVAIVIDTVEAVALWFNAHVLDEVLESAPGTGFPSVTDSDPPAAIRCVLRALGVPASLQHRGPDHVLTSGCAFNCVSVSPAPNVCLAAATVGLPITKVAATNVFDRSAVASAPPHKATTAMHFFDHTPQAEALTDKTNFGWHVLPEVYHKEGCYA